MSDQAEISFCEYCIVELMGHQRAAGLVSEAKFPGGFVRIDVPGPDGETAYTRIVSPGAVYALNPTTKEIAVAAAQRRVFEPVSRWELKALGEPEEVDYDREHDAYEEELP